jgi:hypothetical protein
MKLSEYDAEVGPHLAAIKYYATMCRWHVNAMRVKPPYETAAEDAMAKLETTLQEMLGTVREARANYERKPHVD